jgi:hypothetical protein
MAAGGVAAWVVSQPDEGPISQPLPETSPTTATEPRGAQPMQPTVTEAPVAGSDRDREVVAGAVAEAVGDDDAADEEVAADGVPASMDDEDELEERSEDRRRRQRARIRRIRRGSTTSTASPMREPETRAPAATEMTATPMQETPTMRGSPLPGLDAFDRSVQN